MKYKNDLIFLFEPYYHGIQYIDVLKKKQCEYVILRRKECPITDEDHEAYVVDFSDTDGIVRLMRERIDKGDYDKVGVIAGNDFCIPYVFEIGTKLGVVSNTKEAGQGARNKIIMRQMLKAGNVPEPFSKSYFSVEEIEKDKSEFHFPLIIKPSDMTSSMGVRLVKGYDELLEGVEEIFKLQNNFLNYSVEGAVLIEEYVVGPEFSVELLLQNGKILFSSVTEKHKGELPFFVETGHVVPSSVTSKEEDEILIRAAKQAVDAIGINHGPAHVEIVLTDKGPAIIELAARIGGDNIMILVREATGIYIPELVVDVALGYEVSSIEKKNNGSAIKFITAAPGIVKAIEGYNDIKNNENVVDFKLSLQIGDKVEKLESSEERVGYFIVKAESNYQALEIANNLQKRLTIVTSGETA